MPYKYVAYTSAGEKVEGVLEVETQDAAEEALRNSDMSIAEVRGGPSRTSEIRFKVHGNSDMTVVELRRSGLP